LRPELLPLLRRKEPTLPFVTRLQLAIVLEEGEDPGRRGDQLSAQRRKRHASTLRGFEPEPGHLGRKPFVPRDPDSISGRDPGEPLGFVLGRSLHDSGPSSLDVTNAGSDRRFGLVRASPSEKRLLYEGSRLLVLGSIELGPSLGALLFEFRELQAILVRLVHGATL